MCRLIPTLPRLASGLLRVTKLDAAHTTAPVNYGDHFGSCEPKSINLKAAQQYSESKPDKVPVSPLGSAQTHRLPLATPLRLPVYHLAQGCRSAARLARVAPPPAAPS